MIRTWLAGIFLAIAAFISPTPANVPKEKPLEKYTLENLQKREGVVSQIFYDRDLFYYYSDGKKVTGRINYPKKSNGKIVVMLHGSATKEEYYPGFGTQRVAEQLAKNGYTTYAPDYFGFGGSASSSADDFEDRFQTYTTNLDLLASIDKPVSLWAHSNGGQIALSILAITGKEYPTVLWNPVTKPFPYNIIYFTDGYDDEGKWLRGALANFEKDYDVNKYSFDKYLENIKAPILLQQGEADEWVPVRWNRDFNLKFKTLNLKLIYKEYPGANHNLVPGWNDAVKDLLDFYKRH